MPSRYQTFLTISGLDSSGPDLLEDVRNHIRGIVHKQFGIPLAAWTEDGVWENENGELRIDSDRRDSFAYFTLTWRRPDEREMRWRLSTKGDDVEAEVQVLGPDNDRRTARAPALLDDVLRTYHCRIQGETPHTDVVTVTDENADWYVESLILAQERRIPVVAVSERLRGEPDTGIARALNILRGIATVVTYSYVDSASINSGLRRLACSGGEVRVYRPGASRMDAQELHRKWRPNDVDWGDIRDECMHLLSLNDGPRLYHDVREEIFRRWDAELEEAEGEVAEDATRNEQLALENERLETELKDAKATYTVDVRELRDDLTTEKRAREDADAELLKFQFAQSFSELMEKERGESSKDSAALQVLKDQNEELTKQLDEARGLVKLREDERDELKRERDDLRGQLEEAPTATNKHSQRGAGQILQKEMVAKDQQIEELGLTVGGLMASLRAKDVTIGELGNELEEYRQGNRSSSDYVEERPDIIDEPEEPESAPLSGPRTVSEVILFSQNLSGLRYLDGVSLTAADSNFAHLDSLERALQTISECGIARANGPLGMTPEAWFKEHGVDYRPHESEETNRRFARVYRDGECGIDLDMEKHIALGGGGNRDPKDVIRIHMAWCDREKLWVIGHVGRHLDVATS